ncbi:high affinity immunoglobulin epsilon receptor subunit beta-like isoform X2 [Hemiscyllium ocellatum]|uniref:high affinity immunoglobulin epsilon receptor subunit beta-like isoform X2 n=1 Tax=Hemiscyllium ocellatum TaxID=170820 RepID=UPI002966A3E0|nr:high affinity immunoglobulin epsilon receptor subunit beta-like isoform X2 [Hemiscyllium ocellatum]
MATEGSPPGSPSSPHVSDANAAQCTMPDPIKRFRNCEPKALGVALLMLGLIVFSLEIRCLNLVPSKVIQSGSPFLVAVLFVLTGTLVLLGDQKPRQGLLRACLASAIVTMVVSAIELVVYLVDISEHRKRSLLCLVGEDTQRCYHLLGKQRVLYVNVPIFYLLTLSGLVLCIIVSTRVYQLVRLGDPEMEQVIHVVLGLTIPLLTLETLSINAWEMVKVGVNAWLTLQCVATGTVSILAENRPTVNMIRVCLTLNILCALITAIYAIILLEHASEIIFCVYYPCEDTLEIAMSVFPLLFDLLEHVVSVVMAAYSCKSLRSVPLTKAAVVLNAPSAPVSSSQ